MDEYRAVVDALNTSLERGDSLAQVIKVAGPKHLESALMGYLSQYQLEGATKIIDQMSKHKLDKQQVISALISHGKGFFLLDHLDKFGNDKLDIFRELYKKFGQRMLGSDELDKLFKAKIKESDLISIIFPDGARLMSPVALEALLPSFSKAGQSKIFRKLVHHREFDMVRFFMERVVLFSDLSVKDAEYLMKNSYMGVAFVDAGWDHFHIPKDQEPEMIKAMVRNWKPGRTGDASQRLREYCDAQEILDKSWAMAYAESGVPSGVFYYIDKYETLDKGVILAVVSTPLLDRGESGLHNVSQLMMHWDQFSGHETKEDQKEILQAIFSSPNRDSDKAAVYKREKFNKISDDEFIDIVKKNGKNGTVSVLVGSCEKFKSVYHKPILQLALEKEIEVWSFMRSPLPMAELLSMVYANMKTNGYPEWSDFAKCITDGNETKFDDGLALKMIHNGYASTVAEHLDHFPPLIPSDCARLCFNQDGLEALDYLTANGLLDDNEENIGVVVEMATKDFAQAESALERLEDLPEKIKKAIKQSDRFAELIMGEGKTAEDFEKFEKSPCYQYVRGDEWEILFEDPKLLAACGFTRTVEKEKALLNFYKAINHSTEWAWGDDDLDTFDLLAFGTTYNYETRDTERMAVMSERIIHQADSGKMVEWPGVGIKTAFAYLGRHDRGDAIHNVWDNKKLEKILEFDAKTGTYKGDEQLKTFLIQTAKDSSVNYHGLDSYQSLALAVRDYHPSMRYDEYIDPDTKEVYSRQDSTYYSFRFRGNTPEYTPIDDPETIELLAMEEFEPGMKAMGAYDNVKTFRKQVELRSKMTPEMKASLEKMAKENPRLHQYISRLLEHPTVDGAAVLKMATSPEEFFGKSDGHAVQELQSGLQPTQLAEVGDENYRIALNATEIRDALVEGKIDAMCPFTLFARDYEFEVRNKQARQQAFRISHIEKAIEKDMEAFAANFETDSTLQIQEKEYLRIQLELFKWSAVFDFESWKKFTQERADKLISKKKFPNRDELLRRVEQVKSTDGLIRIWEEILVSNPNVTAKFLVDNKRIDLKPELTELPDDQELFSRYKEDLRIYLKMKINRLHQAVKGEKIVIRAEVLPHSDPRYATIGDDTSCCMAFGSGKQVVYMWYPQCGAMTLSFRHEGQTPDEARIAVQSVLTMNMDVGRFLGGGKALVIREEDQISQNKTKEPERISLVEALGDDFLERLYQGDNFVVVADNAEGQTNFIKRLMANDDNVVPNVYRQFFEAYREANPWFAGMPVNIGVGYSDYCKSLKTTDNHVVPLGLVSYSDNTGKKSYSLLEREDVGPPESRKVGIQSLDWRHALATAYIEEKAYGDNLDIASDLTTNQKILVAAGIAAQKFETKPTTIGYFDDDGVLRGHVLAFPAKDYSRFGETNDEIKLYVHEIAILPEYQGRKIGMQLIQGLLERVNSDEKLRQMPIVMKAREGTSYPIIKKYADKFDFEITNDRETEMGGESFHIIELRRKK